MGVLFAILVTQGIATIAAAIRLIQMNDWFSTFLAIMLMICIATTMAVMMTACVESKRDREAADALLKALADTKPTTDDRKGGESL